MRKEEFLQILRRSLTGDVPPGVVEENIRYYDGYIAEEVRKGRGEEEVIQEIGDPRLIAKTIEDTTDVTAGSGYRDSEGYEYGGREEPRQSTEGSFHIFRLDKWYGKLLLALAVISVVYLLIMIIGGIFSILLPLVVPLMMIWLVVTVIRNIWRR